LVSQHFKLVAASHLKRIAFPRRGLKQGSRAGRRKIQLFLYNLCWQRGLKLK
jgi:hypothetical protein